MRRITVIIPTYKEASRIEGALRAVQSLDWDSKDLEVIVADYPSGDTTRDIVEQFQTEMILQYIEVPEQGRAQGLNYAIKCASGEFIVRIDSRTTVPPNYIKRLHSTMLETGASVVGGVQRAKTNTGDAWQRAIGVAMNSVCGAGPAQHRRVGYSGPVDNVYLGIYKKRLFDEIGFFDEESPVISEEVDLHYRVLKNEGIVWLCSDLLLQYEPRKTLWEQGRLYFRYGGAKAAFIKKYGRIITLRQLVAPLFFLSILIGVLAVPFVGWLKFPLLIILALYIWAVSVCTFFSAKAFSAIALWPRVIIVSCVMHFSYALGYFKKLLIPDPDGGHWGY